MELLGRIVIHHDVRIDSVAFDDPILACLGVGREFWLEELATIGQRQGIADANDAAPGTFADEFAHAEGFEAVGEDVAIGGGEFINQGDHGSGKGVGRIGARGRIAGHFNHDERAPQPFDDQR